MKPSLNMVAAHMSPQEIAELYAKFGMEFKPSASEPNFEPQPKRTAKGKSLPRTQATSVPSATSAKKVRPNNPTKDKTGHRQVSRYKANKIATRTLDTKQVEPSYESPTKEELYDRYTNPGNKHYVGNPVIDRSTKRPIK